MNEKQKEDLEKLKEQNKHFAQAAEDWKSFSKGMMIVYGGIVIGIVLLFIAVLQS